MKKNNLTSIIVIVFMIFVSNIYAQKTNQNNFNAIDDYVKKLGSLDTLTMGTISNILTKNFSDKTSKTRAIYYWITNNISLDLKAVKNANNDKTSSTDVLHFRKTTSVGYSNLFQDLCSSAGIRCLTVNGYIKNNNEIIKSKKAEINHTWNVVQLGQSPETWYYVDVCMGAGYADADYKNYTKNFNSDYFFTEKSTFNLLHFPDNVAWYLGQGSKNKNDFFELPFFKSMAISLGLKKFTPSLNVVKSKINKPILFSYQLKNDIIISKITFAIGEGKKNKNKDIPFVFSNGVLTFSYTFNDIDNEPISILINNKEFVAYNFIID